jgi:hypothetical protein
MPTAGATARQGAPVSQQGYAVTSTMGAPNPRYAAPTEGTNDPYYVDSPVAAWGPSLRSYPGGSPDPHRTNTMQQYDAVPAGNRPPEEFYSSRFGTFPDLRDRHKVEFQDADGYAVAAPTGHRTAPHPASIPPPEPRPTSRLAPRSYIFTRPFDQSPARHFNGWHFSMADHRRTYPILGMQTPGTRRNTYRADPPPWDQNIVDMPDIPSPAAGAPIAVYDIPPSGNRGWRL